MVNNFHLHTHFCRGEPEGSGPKEMSSSAIHYQQDLPSASRSKWRGKKLNKLLLGAK